ncbi:hypothetical protein BHE90_009732 [Fusarium euwallaceae]|uniref:Major facilitator superfamily (MFS) profile domain-containing protein n=1 Tax=Fusarium euwallaceae TaxID=1147111 RepID=A0A430LJG3_9HYPO|nr:hypothetical protein BHE90_009732 [Fusarium euwallaceae]
MTDSKALDPANGEEGIVLNDVETLSPSPEPAPRGFDVVKRNKRVLGWCLLIYLLPINFGFEIALVGKVLAIPSFLERFGSDTDSGIREIPARTQQILSASSTIGIFVAAFTTGFLSDIWGRRNVVFVGCFLCITGILVQGFCTSIMMLFGGKLTSTLGFGLGHSLAPVFVAEIAPDELRGVCLTLINTMIVIGAWGCSLVGYGGTFIDGDWGWRMPIFAQLVPPVLMLILGFFLLPESPSWLLMKGQRERAAQCLRKFRGQDFDAEAALAVMEATLEKERSLNEQGSSYLECFKGSNLRRTLIVVQVYVAQQFVGSGFVSGYLPYFFTLSGVRNPVGVAQISYSLQLLGNIMSWPLVDRLGRRPLIVWGTAALAAVLLVIGGISTINKSKPVLSAVVAFMSIWGFLYQLTLGAVAYAVGGETPTPRLRQKTYSINVMSNTAASVVVTQLIPILINPGKANLGGKVAFVFFGPSCLLFISLWLTFPELKGRSYLEMEEMFQKGVPSRQFKSYVCKTEIIQPGDGEKPVVVMKD